MHWIDTCDEERLKADIVREYNVDLLAGNADQDSYYSNLDEEYEYIREYTPRTLPELEKMIRSGGNEDISKELVRELSILSFKYGKPKANEEIQKMEADDSDKKGLPEYIYVF